MNKKILIILLSGIFIAGLATFLFFSNNNEGKTISKNLNLIPLDANMIIEINDFHDVIDIANSRASYWDTLTDLDNFSKLNKNLFFLDSISSKSPVFEKLMKNSEIIISFHSIGSLKTGKIIITKIPEEIKEKNIINEIKAEIGDKKIAAVLGGMHLKRRSSKEIDALIEYFKGIDFDLLVPMHCTGREAAVKFKNAFKKRVKLASVGDYFKF